MNYKTIYRTYHVANRRLQAGTWIQIIDGSEGDYLKSIIAGFKEHDLDIRSLPGEIFESIRERKFDRIKELIESIDRRLVDAPEWLALSSLFIALGRYHIALLLREIAMLRIEDYEGRIDKWLIADLIIGKKIERKELDSIIPFLKWTRLMRSACGISVFNPKFQQVLKTCDYSPVDEEDQKFLDLVKNKKLAIVGPLKLSAQEENELAEFELLAKLNDLEYFVQEQENSKRIPDIVYYTRKREAALNDFKGACKSCPTFIVGKRGKQAFAQSGLRSHYRKLDDYNAYTLNGGLNMIPRMIIDIAFFKPQELKVFGVDLYTSLNFDKGYGGIQQTDWKVVFDHFINHDLITQYKVMQGLYENGIFTADGRLEGIMQMGVGKFLDFFEQKFQEVYY